jgi:hypothetical protein
MAVIAARVGHEDPKQRHPYPWCGTERSDVERPKRANFFSVTEPGRWPFPIVGGERH